MNQVQTTTAAMSTTTELLAEYNRITYDKVRYHVTPEHAKELARAIIQGDTSGKLPAKGEKIAREDCEGEYFIPAILATKPGKLTPQQAVAPLASRDTLRPAMMCVYYDTTRAAVVATCGHVLMSFPCGPLAPASGLLHPVTLEPLKVGDVVNKNTVGTGDVDNRYPDYVSVIRLPNPNGPAVTLDVQSFRNQLAGIARATRFVNLYTGIRARIQHEGQDFYVDAALCDNVLRAMQASGTTRVNLDLSEPNRALQFTDVNDAKKLALIMPVQGTSYGKEIAYCTVLDTAVGQLLTSPASVKRVTVKKPVQPRAVQVLSKDEKKSLAVSVKQYEAADTTEQTRMIAHVQQSAKQHTDTLRQLAYRQLAQRPDLTEFIPDTLFWARVGRAFLATVTPTPAQATSPAQAAAFTRMQAAHIVFEATYQTADRPAAIVELEAAEVMFIADMPGATVWVRDEQTGCELQPVTHAFEAGDIRTPMYGVRNWGEFCPADMSKDEALAYFAAYDANRERLCAIEDELTSPVVAGPTYEEMCSALADTGFFVGGLTDEGIAHYYAKLIASAPTAEADAPAADDIALLTEHQADEYLRTCNDEQPDELIRARHGETTAVLTPRPMTKRKHHNHVKTHCPQGHEFTADNTRIRRRGVSQIERTCKKCAAEKSMAWRRTYVGPVRYKPTMEERFWPKVNKTPGLGPDGDCWEWEGNIDNGGYGRFRAENRRNGSAHRYAYELANGPIAPGLFICHKCDHPKCVNPSHLFLGTRSDNMNDMYAKGRGWMQNKTSCAQGHEYTVKTIYYNKQGHKLCKVCRANYARIYRAELSKEQSK